MKTKIFALVLAIGTVLLCGCQKESSKGLEGSYTYKISGTVTLMATQLAGLDAATLAAYKAAGMNVDPVTVGLYPEQGQMHIIGKDGSDSKVIITFNDLLGNVNVTEGTSTKDELTIDGGEIKAVQLTDGTDKIGAGMVLYSGTGKKYDDMLIVDLTYQGEFSVNGVPMTLVASDVKCLAQAN